MFNNPIVRSLLQIAGLSVITLFLTTASPKTASAIGLTAVPLNAASAFDECDDEYAACVERCGTWDWTWDGYSMDYGAFCYDWYESHWFDCWVPHLDWHFHSDIQYFECIPNFPHGQCECAY